MDIYLYVDRPSPLHRMDPRAKLIFLIGLLLLVVSVDHPALPGALLLLVLAAASVARAWPSLRRVRSLLAILSIFSLVTWSLFAQGTTPLIGGIEVESVLYGVGTALKLTTTITASVVFLATTKNEEIAAGLIAMGLPYNVAFAFSTALRLVPTFVGAGATIVQAQRSRGLDVESGHLIQRMRKYLPLVVPIFASAIRSTNRMAMALEAKGFGARPRRTYYLQLRMGPSDWAAVILALGMGAAFLYLRLTGWGKIPGLVH
jgi:energy-coupling factor transport system permease protein